MFDWWLGCTRIRKENSIPTLNGMLFYWILEHFMANRRFPGNGLDLNS